jgi:hypothetical protein
MYGKRRITLTKDNQIVLAGGKTWHPIGRYQQNKETSIITGWFLKSENQWDRNKEDGNNVEFEVSNKTEIRKAIETHYPEYK